MEIRDQFHDGLRQTWASGIGDGAFVWCYTDAQAYDPGETVDLRISANVGAVDVTISRDGATPVVAHHVAGLATAAHPAPPDAYATGCSWPVACRWTIPAEAPSGAYVVRLQACADARMVGHHLFIVRPGRVRGNLLLVAATATWTAYNDWGGASHYYGVVPDTPMGMSPRLAIARPWTRGMAWLPPGAPRKVPAHRPRFGEAARYESSEWAFLNGYGRQYSSAGWAMFEQPFVAWAEAAGYRVDIVAQSDLEYRPDILDGYACIAFAGHDEYWSWAMRDTVDGYVERGGRVARFAGNFLWQIRLDGGGAVQVCHKTLAHERDAGTGRLMTSAWEDRAVGRPGAETFGVNALRGMYAGWGGFCPRAAKGFIVFRDDHWALAGTGLRYADMFGDDANIFGYEVDGLEYTMQDGLPVPLGTDGAPPGTTILAMNWATLAETPSGAEGERLLVGGWDAALRNRLVAGYENAPDRVRGSGMIVNFTRGRGEVFTAASCEWVAGLKYGDPYTTRITRNVLDRYLAS